MPYNDVELTPYYSNFPLSSPVLVHMYTTATLENVMTYLFMSLWILGLVSFIISSCNEHAAPTPDVHAAPAAPDPNVTTGTDDDKNWDPIGTYHDSPTHTTHLLYRHRHTRVWRYKSKNGYMFPKGRDLSLYGTRLT